MHPHGTLVKHEAKAPQVAYEFYTRTCLFLWDIKHENAPQPVMFFRYWDSEREDIFILR